MPVVTTLPALVDGAWQTLVRNTTGAGPEDEPWAAEQARWAAMDASFLELPIWEPAGVWVEEELKVIEAAERVKAWADAQGLAALRRLHEGVGMVVRANADLVGPHDGPLAYASVVAETTTATVEEVALATGLPEGEVAARLALALDVDQRAGPVAAALHAGTVSLDRAERIQQATQDLDPDVARAVAVRLLGAMPDGSVRSHRSFTRELRRQVVLHAPDPAQTRADALRDRCAYAFLEPEGTGRLTVTADAGRVVAALERVDALARAFRSAGDSRTLAQLRSDVALDLLLYAWADPTTLPADADATAAQTFAGRPPAAHVNLTVALTMLLGLDDRPGELVGHGFVPAPVARAMATAAGSVWRRLVIDPVDGTALELSTGRYRPTTAMAEQVAALDGLCQAPGCTVPAYRCDVDHAVPWPQGPTLVRNLHSRHRRHHNHKTRQTWTAESLPDGSTEWLTVSRREYASHRQSYDDPLTHPVGTAELAQADSSARHPSERAGMSGSRSIFPGRLGAGPYLPGAEGEDADGFRPHHEGVIVKKQTVSILMAVTAGVGWSVLNPATAVASSPNPASSCIGQLSQGATPHGLSQAQPGDLGSFVSQLARSGAYGDVASSLAREHGDLFSCVAVVPPLG